MILLPPPATLPERGGVYLKVGKFPKLERQNDMLLSNLYAYVEALGGEVEIRAKFPDQEVQITQFREIEKLKAALAPTAKRKKSA